jgi:serine/threonine protein phosphatase 1
MNKRTFVLGDIHGAHRALVQVFERSGFDPENDLLIFLGDVADGWPETRACIDELLKVHNLVAIAGNHDEWFQEWVEGGYAEPLWLHQGGRATYEDYGRSRENVPQPHRDYLKRMKPWHQIDDVVFVHGGFRGEHPMTEGMPSWDRTLWNQALAQGEGKLTQFREVYVGHTSTTFRGYTEPVQKCEVWNLDQGAGWEGRLSIMDIETKEFWQSDVVAELYPEAAGRRGAA